MRLAPQPTSVPTPSFWFMHLVGLNTNAHVQYMKYNMYMDLTFHMFICF